MKRAGWPVTPESGPAPAGKPDECFYCRVKVGGEHAPDCVLRRRTVVCRVSVDLVRVVPEDWDGEMIEFQMNDSSSCADNLLQEVADLHARLDADGRCSCHLVEGRYLREADEDDEAATLCSINSSEPADTPEDPSCPAPRSPGPRNPSTPGTPA